MRMWDVFIDALYPRGLTCCVCGRNARLDGHGICDGCRGLLQPCGEVPAPKHTDGAVAGLIYGGRAREMVLRFKYGGARHLGDTLAGFIELPGDWPDSVLIPVPMYPGKERRRGYNQAGILADELAARYGLPVRAGLVRRVRDTRSQASMPGPERRENVKGAFRARGCHGLSAILVDDVLTTGSTASECARAMKAAGAEQVYLAAACHALSTEDG